MSADRESSGEVHCGLCGKPMNLPVDGYAWTSDGIYHVLCYENPHLNQDDVVISRPSEELTA